ncbi:hypothetical protein [Micromonospora sp. WMMD998]|nr:hypothetical protein [Micromonospora sp. WMMD998]WFE37249.1 hypothetical protein O7619_01870 [Micromonospora sp. WMMD998]
MSGTGAGGELVDRSWPDRWMIDGPDNPTWRASDLANLLRETR